MKPRQSTALCALLLARVLLAGSASAAEFDFANKTVEANGSVPKKLDVYQLLKVKDGQLWDICAYGLNNEGKGGKFKYTTAAWLADDVNIITPRVFAGEFTQSVKLKKDGGMASGLNCGQLFVSGASFKFAIVSFKIKTQSSRKLKSGSVGEWGVASNLATGSASISNVSNVSNVSNGSSESNAVLTYVPALDSRPPSQVIEEWVNAIER